MTTVIGGSAPSITFSDSTTQSTAALPLTGGSLTGNVTSTGSISSVNTFGFKNRIINGAMVIDQRNAGASITPTTINTYCVDRWSNYTSQSSKYSIQQNAGSVTPPVGFSNYLGVTSLSAYSVGASDYFNVLQKIEGFNFADLGFGTANAKTITISFWVYSSLTGSFGGSIQNSAQSRSYPFSYTISSANTWTQISITIAGDTTGTWVGATNGTGAWLIFNLGAGSTYSGTANTWASANYTNPTSAVSVVGTNGATFYITGVQLEVGAQATSFDYRPYTTELALCQRYFETSYTSGTAVGTATSVGRVEMAGSSDGNNNAIGYIKFAVAKRAAPTMTAYQIDATSGVWFYNRAGPVSATGTVTFEYQSTGSSGYYLPVGASLVVCSWGGQWLASAEL